VRRSWRPSDASDETQERLCAPTFEALTTPELMRLVERDERDERRDRPVRHALIDQLANQANEEELDGTLPD